MFGSINGVSVEGVSLCIVIDGVLSEVQHIYIYMNSRCCIGRGNIVVRSIVVEAATMCGPTPRRLGLVFPCGWFKTLRLSKNKVNHHNREYVLTP